MLFYIITWVLCCCVDIKLNIYFLHSSILKCTLLTPLSSLAFRHTCWCVEDCLLTPRLKNPFVLMCLCTCMVYKYLGATDLALLTLYINIKLETSSCGSYARISWYFSSCLAAVRRVRPCCPPWWPTDTVRLAGGGRDGRPAELLKTATTGWLWLTSGQWQNASNINHQSTESSCIFSGGFVVTFYLRTTIWMLLPWRTYARMFIVLLQSDNYVGISSPFFVSSLENAAMKI